jgi:FXSXX-COOH protein
VDATHRNAFNRPGPRCYALGRVITAEGSFICRVVSGGTYMRDAPCDVESTLPDLADVDLAIVAVRQDSVLMATLERLLEQAASGQQVVAGFNSAI